MNQAATLVCVITRETQSSQGVAHLVWCILCMSVLRLGRRNTIFRRELYLPYSDMFVHHACVNKYGNTDIHTHTQTVTQIQFSCNQADSYCT